MTLRLFLSGYLLIILISAAPLAAKPNGAVPRFEDYSVHTIYHGKVASPVLKTDQDRTYRTMLRNGSHRKPDFAGHYIVTIWGCGAGCVMGAVEDAKTGRVFWIPFSVSGWTDTSDNFQPISYRINSRLIVLTGMLNEAGSNGPHYYVFDGSHFKLLR